MFTRTAVRSAVAEAHEAPVSTIAPVEAGQNHAYRVAFRDGYELFVKVGTRFPSAFEAEPKTTTVVDRKTGVPVPQVHATGSAPLGYPFAVYEFVGDAEHDRIGDLPSATARRLCREAGEHLAALHEITFQRFGGVGVERDALGVVRPREGHEMLRRSLDRQISALRDTPFADRRQALEEFGTERIDSIEFDGVRPTLVHGDYRLDNLRVDPSGDRVTTAVLDWELPTASDRLWDVVMTLALLTDGYGIDPDDRQSLRVAFREGYGSLPSGKARWDCYELLARLRLARHLTLEMDGRSEAAVSTRIDQHHDAFEDLLAGTPRFQRPSDAT